MKTTALNFGSLTHALIAGVGRYRSESFADLPTPAHQANALGEALTLVTGCAIPANQVRVLTDCDAGQFLDELQHLSTSLGADDVLIVYFSGHGFSLESEFFLCFQGADRERTGSTCVGSRALDDILTNLPVRGVLVILDCCQSAGFAENAPQFVRTLKSGQFRLLLSASRSNSPSWELPDGRGTLFTRHLLRVIRGEEKISETPGFVYFSELLTYIQEQVNRDMESAYPNVPSQEPVSVGVYSQDPLLFVHHALTLEQIKVRTDRYTRAHLIRAIRKTVMVIAAFLMFCFGTWYTALDHSSYLVLEPRGIVLYRGHPAYNAFGFPHLAWVYPAKDFMVKDGDRLRGSRGLVLPNQGHVGDEIAGHLKPEFAAAHYFNSNEPAKARRVIEGLIDASHRIASQFPGIVAGEWADLATATTADIDLLHQMASRSDLESFVVAQIYRGLMRVDPQDTLQESFLDPERIVEDDEIQSTVLESLRAPCSEEMAAYLSRLFRTKAHPNLRLKVLDSALRVGYRANAGDIIGMLRNSNVVEVYLALGRYAALSKIANLASLLAPSIGGADEWMKEKAFTVLTASGRPLTCAPSWQIRPGTRVSPSQIDALLTACPTSEVIRVANSQPGAGYLLVRARHGLVSPDELAGAAEISSRFPETMEVFQSIRVLFQSDPVKYRTVEWQLNSSLDLHSKFRDGFLRGEAISLLALLGANARGASAYFNDSSINVREAAYAWALQGRIPSVVEQMIGRLAEPNSDYLIDLLSTVQLSSAQITRVSTFLSGSDEARPRAAAILAVQASTDRVVKLFRDPDSSVRLSAKDYFLANPRASEIAAAIEGLVPPDGEPSRSGGALHGMAERKAELDSTPKDLLPWRARLLNKSRQLSAGERLLLSRIGGRPDAPSN